MMRAEGKMWNAYYSPTGAADDAVLLASIATRIVADQVRKAAFQWIVTDFVAQFIKEIIGKEPAMEMRAAPAHEKAGSA